MNATPLMSWTLLAATFVCCTRAQPPKATPTPAPSRTLDAKQLERLGKELDQALIVGDFAKARELVAAGADVNLPDGNGRHLTHSACSEDRYKDSLAVLRFLKECGADLNAPDRDGWPPIAEAVWRGNVGLLPFLYENGADLSIRIQGAVVNRHYTLLHNAAFQGRIEPVRWLLDHGLDCNAQADDGDTALATAASKGYPDIVALLLERGANRNLQDKRGKTALDHAKIEAEGLNSSSPADLRARYEQVLAALR
jgi:ankyrin repeat protein